MAATQGDLIRITDFQSYLGQQVLNVFYYRIVPVGGIADSGYLEMLEWFADDVITPVSMFQSDYLRHTNVTLENLTNGVDIRDLTTDIYGDITTADTTVTPSYVSLGFIMQRESRVTRNGYKRFAGVPEISVSGNTYVNPGGTVIADIEEALAKDWVEGIVTVAEPIIVKRPVSTPPVASYQYASIGSARLVGLGTQNTRKAGRGS